MFYKKRIAAAAAILGVLFLAAIFVCAERPYSRSAWLAAIMIIIGGLVLGFMTVRLHDKPDSSFPISATAAVATFWYLVFVAILAMVPILGLDVRFKYYMLAHLACFGLWGIMLMLFGMGERAADGQDAELPIIMECRKAWYLRISDIIDDIRRLDIEDRSVIMTLTKLKDRFRHGFVKVEGVADIEARITLGLKKLEAAVEAKDENEMRSISKEIEFELSCREHRTRI